MKFSVLMSVYYKENADYFDMALKSILIEQTVLPDEFVLVCDGKLSDDLEDVIARYVDQFPHVMKICRIENNGGLGNALKVGLEQCTFEYVARADSDDICDRERFEKQLAYLEEHPEVDVLGTGIFEFGVSVEDIKSHKKMPSKHVDILKMAKTRNPINHMTVFMKKDAVLKAGSYQHLPCVEDYFLWVRLIVSGATFANLSEPLVFARVGNGMAERRGNRQHIRSWHYLNQYMLKNKMINIMEFLVNMVAIRVFIYTPLSVKKWMYKFLLRR
jgi:glycosyltransferase involved in cell wall biosynthesis